DGIRDWSVTGVQTCALPISNPCFTLGCSMYPVIWKMKAQVSTVAAIGSVLSRDRCRTGIPSAFHTSACRRAAADGDSKMILSAGIGRASCRGEEEVGEGWVA